jgi:hypothetical protein
MSILVIINIHEGSIIVKKKPVPKSAPAGTPLKKSKKGAKPAPMVHGETSPNVEPELVVELRTLTGLVPRSSLLASKRELQKLAMQWQYRLENRERWAGKDLASERLSGDARRDLEKWGYAEDSLRVLADVDVVEVRIPFSEESNDWEMRVFPWEFILSEAARHLRRIEKPLIVVRHLDVVGGNTRVVALGSKPKTLLFIVGAPGPLSKRYDFTMEKQLVYDCCGRKDVQLIDCENPTIDTLREEVRKNHPDIVHVSAVDTRLAFSLLSRGGNIPDPDETSEWRSDGIVLAGEVGLQNVRAAEFGEFITSGGQPPMVVGYNVWRSGSRIAPLTVARGARIAIGFQTTFDDRLAELFFSKFYETFRKTGWNAPLSAFQAAWESLRGKPDSLTGTGILFWSAESVLTQVSPSVSKKEETPRVLTARSARGKIKVIVKPIERLNYALAHNNSPMFEEFTIHLQEGFLHDVRVEVQLFDGAESHPYVTMFDLGKFKDLTKIVKLPLTSTLERSVDENVHTSFRVRVSCGDIVFYEDTHRITLLPIDLWKSTDEECKWLPSFVLPRDPAVTKILRSATGMLACLSDDPTAAFDGYQTVDTSADDPTNYVDLQVRAIWTAMILELPMSYMNPPPSYESDSQRLRTPSETLETEFGTCIDTSLLLAACLEFVGIYPVIFLIEGHAFPGYWRDEKTYQDFVAGANKSEKESGQDDGSIDAEWKTGSEDTVELALGCPWMIGRIAYSEIMEYVNDSDLVPLESTLLTNRSGFEVAMDEGLKNLRSREEFYALVDIQLARDNRPNPVTPLPIGGIK